MPNQYIGTLGENFSATYGFCVPLSCTDSAAKRKRDGLSGFEG
jgi:hypothetical protein